MKAWNSTLNVGKGFKPKTSSFGTKKSRLRKVRPESVLTPNEAAKQRIQSILREYVILRDGGCFLRYYPEAGKCGGYGSKSGILVLQFDHLNSRRHSISYADPRLGVCVCQRHHIYWKKQEPDLYTKLVRAYIGPTNSILLDAVQADHRAYKKDWILEEIFLKGKLANLKQGL